MRIILLIAAVFSSVAMPAGAQTAGVRARDIVHAAERAVSDDSADAVRARWGAVLERDSSDIAATLGMASLARLAYDFPAAGRLFQRMLSPARAADEWAVQAQIGLYRVALAEGDYRRADSLLTAAIGEARRIGDRGGEIDALIGFSNTRSATGGLEASLAVLDSVEALLPPGESWERAQYLCRLGLYRAVASDAGASKLTSEGTALAERLGERRLAGHCLEAHAMTHSLLGREDSVLPVMDRAERLLRETRDHASLARLMSRRSDELQFRGRLGEAKVALRQLIAEAEKSRNRERFAYAYGGLGMLALRLNDLSTAVEHFDRAAALYDSLGHKAGSAIARANRAWVLAHGDDLAAARSAFQSVLERALNGGDLEDEVFARQAIARVAIRQGDWAEAAGQLDAGEASARKYGREEEARESFGYDRGRIAIGQGDLDRAERFFRGFLAGVERGNHLHRHLIQMRLAEIQARRGDLDRAERQMALASEELESWRGSLRDDELRRFAFSASALGEHDPQAPVSRVLAALAKAKRIDTAFLFAEQRRARGLTDRLNQADVLRESGVAAEARAHRVRPVSASELAAALPDDSTAVLEYVAGTEGAPTTLFVVTRSGTRAYLLPSADSLAAPIRRLVAMLETGGNPTGIALTLGAALVAPAAESLPARVTRLLVIPDGPLHRIPFDVLRLPDGRAVVDRWAVGLAPSAGVALGLWRSRPAPPQRDSLRLLALGDPMFPGEQAAAASREARIYRSAFAANGGLTRLAGSGEEAREVARYAARSEVRLRADASEEWLKRAELDGFRVIHLATHALVDETSLVRTSLALAPGTGEDGFVSPADLASLDLDADLVVLSACRTAGGVAITGEGMEGLTAPLVAAGARSVVATQWRIGDRSAVRLVSDFYSGLARGLPVAEALRSAKLAAIARGAPPSDWAGFTVVGDPFARVALATPGPRRQGWWIAAGGGLALLVLGTYLVRRRGRSSERRGAEETEALTHH